MNNGFSQKPGVQSLPNGKVNPPTPQMGGFREVTGFKSPPYGGFRGLILMEERGGEARSKIDVTMVIGMKTLKYN